MCSVFKVMLWRSKGKAEVFRGKAPAAVLAFGEAARLNFGLTAFPDECRGRESERLSKWVWGQTIKWPTIMLNDRRLTPGNSDLPLPNSLQDWEEEQSGTHQNVWGDVGAPEEGRVRCEGTLSERRSWGWHSSVEFTGITKVRLIFCNLNEHTGDPGFPGSASHSFVIRKMISH